MEAPYELKTICIILCVILSLSVMPGFAEDGISAESEEFIIPELDSLFTAQTVKLRTFSDESRRVSAYYGPGKNYYTAGAYKPYKQRTIQAYFNEGGWVLIHLKYQTAKERFVYMVDTAFTSLPDVVSVDEMQFFTASTTVETRPRLGPSEEFIYEDHVTSIPVNTTVKAFFQKNGFVYVEYPVNKTIARMWIPTSSVRVIDAGAYTPVEREHLPVKETSSLPVGEWSSWTDQYIEPGDGIEVEERTLYRRKNEIQDWTAWIDGDPPEGDNIESRMVTNPDGSVKYQWREYGYHYHYGEWSDWSENEWANVVSSSDIVESKKQWRYRRTK